ncbi:MAG: hypothetical protein KJ856_17265 [Gammaproteobacteria bacterium]|nr:hypothetical protein [uncultured Shewanella sp.]MBU1393421.1 hypothetical protein [Gammaproteobacteria bacterium]MBU1479594.1 hypothetical protein [Gammaproteobacteria bacterium]MBU2000747.1 hypothetical protein [Gammaproteobacteria bacterium]MBU2131270.1 hypothetical protein [Gammaproteobacteria bacterium]MBU2188740.1 hypothetical protein [Gammaproteobacteria bacterium]
MEKIRIIALCSLLACSIFPASAAQDRDLALATFDSKTAPLLKQAIVLGETAPEDKIDDALERHQGDAVAVLKEGIPQRLAIKAKQQLTLADEYLKYFKALQQQIPHTSQCHQPQLMADFNSQIKELTAYADRLNTYSNIQNLGDAFPALMDMNISQARVNTLTSLFHRFRLCVLGDDTPAIVDGLTGEKGDAIANAFISTFAAKQGVIPPTAPEYMSENDTEDISQFSEIDEPGLIPKKPEQDIGTFDGSQTEATSEISQPISALKFSNKPLGDCIQQQAKLLAIQQSQELSLLNCQFNPTDIVTLQDLSAFNNLDTLSLKGGTLSTLGNLNSNNLKTLMLTDMKVTDFSGKNIKLDSLFLSRISSNNWPSLIELNVQTISIDKTVNCAELKPLLVSEKLIPIHPGQSPTDMAERMQQAEANGIPLLMLECAI